MSRQDKFDELRQKFDFFCYQDFEYHFDNDKFCAKFNFQLRQDENFGQDEQDLHDDNDPLSSLISHLSSISFHPCFEIPARSFYNWKSIPKDVLDVLIFNIGMIELVSYWKIACPKKVVIKPYNLDNEQIRWWKKLYFNGLGEFFYINGISTNFDDFMTIESDSSKTLASCCSSSKDFEFKEDALVPIGGGKDSVVTLEALRKKMNVIPLIINPRGATRECVKAAGFSENDVAVINRTLDPTMLEMNKQGYLNGHTPFSAMLAFYTILLGFATKNKYIALSNESSANEPTVPDTEINHQYSKSVVFEDDFRNYVFKYVNSEIQYFSFLRPLNELQIASLFSRSKAYHKVFRSCNVGSKTDIWCGRCPKCLFTWLALSPFISQNGLTQIFDKNLLKDNELKPILEQLKGTADVKPFECVGTVDEVRACVNNIIQSTDNLKDTILEGLKVTNDKTVDWFLSQFDERYNLPEKFVAILKEVLYG